MSDTFTLKKGILHSLLCLFFSFFAGLANACDTSGYTIDAFTDNGDGTFTINMTVMVGGFPSTSVGSTWGFYWNVDAPIISLSPMSLTSQNGTTVNAVISGMNITWGDPVPSAAQPFVDIVAGEPTQTFPVTVVVQGLPTEWWGGGQEANLCPGGPGTGLANYEGEFPCITPIATPAPPVLTICQGEIATLSVFTNSVTELVTWSPGGQTGETIQVAPTETTVYTITASNVCEQSTSTITVNVITPPVITAANSEIEACEGFPVVMEVIPSNYNFVTWSPTGTMGLFLVDTPPSSPYTYTATASNDCFDTPVDITITTIPPSSVEIVNDDEVICDGDTITLEAEPMYADSVVWQPTGQNANEIDVSPDSTTTYIAISYSTCGLDTAEVEVAVSNGAVNQVMLEACEGETVPYNGIPLAAGSTSTFTYNSFAGCDSVVTVTVAELPHSSEALQLQACEDETITYNGQTLAPGSVTEFNLTAFNGCDSTLTVTVIELSNTESSLELNACEGTTASYNGQSLAPGSVTEFTFTAFNGCDSTVTVTVNEQPVYAFTENYQTCTGTTINYNGQSLAPGTTTEFTFSTIGGCDSVVTVVIEELANFTTSVDLEACTGTNASYNGQSLAPGTVTDFTFTTSNGCDSIVTVTVTEVAAITENLEFDACSGETVDYDGQTLAAGTIQDFFYTTPEGCDSIVTVTVNELQTYATPLLLEACPGSSVSYNGQDLSAGSVTDITLTASNGCDSVVTVTVDEIPILTEAVQLQACSGETVPYNGQPLAAGSVTDFTFTSSLGCDSIVTVSVAELDTYASTLQLQTCTGTTITYNGSNLPPGTMVDFTLTASNGCDSVVTVTVTEVETIEEELDLQACPGTTVPYNGQNLAPGSVTEFTFTSSLGCDSVVTVTVEEIAAITENIELDACNGSTVTYSGQALTPGSVTDFTFTTAQGCDSIVTVTVNELQTYTDALSLQACTGTTVTYNGQTLSPGSVTDFTLIANNGCDSVVTVTVDEVTVITESLTLEACEGTSVLYDGQSLSAGSVTDFNYTSSQGCDSVLTVTVIELAVQTGTVQLAACEGETVDYNGQAMAAGSQTDVILTGSNGCDSVVTVTVATLFPSTGVVTLQGCEGEPLSYNNVDIMPGTSMDFTFTAANGCDSVVTVMALEPLNEIATSEQIEICEGETAMIFGQPIGSPGVYSQTYASANGCDSVHTITLSLTNDLILGFQSDISINLGESVVLNPIVNPTALLTYTWEEDPTLSCLDCKNPVASPLNNTTYNLTITNQDDCSATASVLVAVDRKRGIFIPNAFSPNGDGLNDIFMIFSDQRSVATVNSLRIFSRWGETIYEYYEFQPDDPEFSWDGSHRGKELDPAVFVYFAEIEFVDGETRLYKGEVMLVR